MKIDKKHPARTFTIKNITLSHMADISLQPDELVTFKSENHKEIDVTAKEWGYYLTGSTNGRLKAQGYITVVAKNPENQLYILAYEQEKEKIFLDYLSEQKMEIVYKLNEDLSI